MKKNMKKNMKKPIPLMDKVMIASFLLAMGIILLNERQKSQPERVMEKALSHSMTELLWAEIDHGFLSPEAEWWRNAAVQNYRRLERIKCEARREQL